MKIHLIGACGMGMGSLAGLLQQAGHAVSGCDRVCEPPMSERLAAWGIEIKIGFDPRHLDDGPDLVVVGNVCRADNPEAAAAMRSGLPVKSFPQVLGEMFLEGRHSVVVAGTHGKTTTSALVSHILEQTGTDPSFLFGGILMSTGKGFRLGGGRAFVVEGDEYDSAFFDKRPKYLHYRPRTLVLASVEYDHADIYRDEAAYFSAFRRLVSQLPADGVLVACRDYPLVIELARESPARVVYYGLSNGSGWCARGLKHEPDGVRFEILRDGESLGLTRVPLAGDHNVSNALAALAAADSLGLEPARCMENLSSFPGVARRMQERGTVAGVTIIDDFAHHPTKVRATVRAARRRYPDAHLVAVFEPRSNTSRRNLFQAKYAEAFDDADEVVLTPPYCAEQIPEAERLDAGKLARDISARGRRARSLANAREIVEKLSRELGPGTVVLIMSNGSFDGLHASLLQALSHRQGNGA